MRIRIVSGLGGFGRECLRVTVLAAACVWLLAACVDGGHGGIEPTAPHTTGSALAHSESQPVLVTPSVEPDAVQSAVVGDQFELVRDISLPQTDVYFVSLDAGWISWAQFPFGSVEGGGEISVGPVKGPDEVVATPAAEGGQTDYSRVAAGRVLYTDQRTGALGPNDWTIWLIELGTGQRTELEASDSVSRVFTPLPALGGTHAAWVQATSAEDVEVVVLDLATFDRRVISVNLATAVALTDDFVVYDELLEDDITRQLVVQPVTGGDRRVIATGEKIGRPSAFGSRVAWEVREIDGSATVWTIDLDGTEPARIIARGTGGNVAAGDGFVLFLYYEDHPGVFLADLETGDIFKLPGSDAVSISARLSAAGRRFAWATRDDTGTTIHVAEWDSSR